MILPCKAYKFSRSVPPATPPVVNGVSLQDNVRFGALDQAGTNSTASGVNRGLVDAAIRVGLGVAAALALAFLLEYWDDRLRDEAQPDRRKRTFQIGVRAAPGATTLTRMPRGESSDAITRAIARTPALLAA